MFYTAGMCIHYVCHPVTCPKPTLTQTCFQMTTESRRTFLFLPSPIPWTIFMLLPTYHYVNVTFSFPVFAEADCISKANTSTAFISRLIHLFMLFQLFQKTSFFWNTATREADVEPIRRSNPVTVGSRVPSTANAILAQRKRC